MLKKITENVEIHQTLPDIPNMTTQELKREWDKGSKIIKEKFNELIDSLNEAEVTLYENEEGTSGTVQLSESAERFRYIEIISHRSGRYYSSGKIPSPNGKDVILSTSYCITDGDMTFYQYSKQVNIAGTSITPVYATLMYCSTGGTVVVNTDDNNRIAKVIGYK